MIIDLSSPIELRGYELLHDDTGATRAYIDLFNISDDTVTAYSGTVRWSRDETGQELTDNVSVDRIAIPGGGEFRLMLSTGEPRYADRFEIYFSRVSFENAPDWTPDNGALVDVGETKALEGSELDNLKAKAGSDALMYPETQDEFWRCVCGRINPLSADECARCRRERGYVLGELNRKALFMDDDALAQRAARRKKADKSRSRSEKAKEDADIYIVALIAVVLLFLTASLLVIFI